MASSRASTSAVSLEDWDSLAPLSERARASIAIITEASAEKPLPKSLARFVHPATGLATNPNTRPGTPLQPQNLLRRAASRIDIHGSSVNSSVPGTPRPRSPAQKAFFTSPHQLHHAGGGHTRTQSTATVMSGLAMQIHPAESPSLTASPGRSRTNGQSRHAQPQHDPLEVTSPIETVQQFLDWFGGVEASMESEQEEVFRRYETEVDAYIESCDEALEMLEDSRGLIKEMEANYRFVEENSKALQLACESMLEEQKHLLEVTDAIDSRLEYFKELETATRALSQPGDTIVLHEDFLDMLERLDVCLEFLRCNRNYRDAQVYLIRFQQCLTRAMTLIKMHFLQTMNLIYTEVSQRLASASSSTSGGKAGPANLSETALNALLYAKFSSISETSRTLLYELEKRATANPEEYGSLLQECFGAWFNVRTQLLAPNLAEEVRRMDPPNTELVKLARAGCAYLRNVCSSEWSLFRDFFPTAGQTEIYHYLETLCDYLYDSLRPRILHEPKLEVLCELCNVIQALISLDGDADDEVSESASNKGDMSGEDQYAIVPEDSSFDLSTATVVQTERPAKMRFSHLLSTVLQDTQTRLVFRAQYVMEAEVLNYIPQPEDLNYPECLTAGKDKGKGREVPNLSQWQRENGGNNAMGVVEEDGVVVFKLPPEEIMQNWYPTLLKTLWVLSRLHSYVNTAIFEDFAGEAVVLCRQSLTSASEKIAARPGASRLDGQLFVIRHLLILKEMVRSIDLVQIERAMDFSSMTDALGSLLRNTSTLFNPNALYQLASRGMPSFAETMRDAKRDLDESLKLICEDFMTQSSLLISSSIRAFLTRCQFFLSAAPPGAPAPDLTAQPWASSEEVLKLHDAFVAEGEGMEKGMREILEKMNLFLDEEKTVAVLVPPTQAEVLDHYTTFYNLVRSEYDFGTANALTPPTRIRERLRAIAGSTSAGWSKEREG